MRAAGVAAPFVDADLDRVSVGFGAPAAGPDHDGSGFWDVGGLWGRGLIYVPLRLLLLLAAASMIDNVARGPRELNSRRW